MSCVVGSGHVAFPSSSSSTHFHFKQGFLILARIHCSCLPPWLCVEGEYCVCNHSHTDIFRCDESNRYIYIRVCQKQQPLYIQMYNIYVYICICIYVYTTNVIVEININCTKLTMYYNYNSIHYFLLFSVALECMQMF